MAASRFKLKISKLAKAKEEPVQLPCLPGLRHTPKRREFAKKQILKLTRTQDIPVRMETPKDRYSSKLDQSLKASLSSSTLTRIGTSPLLAKSPSLDVLLGRKQELQAEWDALHPDAIRRKRESLEAEWDEIRAQTGGPASEPAEFMKSPSCPGWLKHDKEVLRFSLFFKEAMQERGDETYCVRKCTLFYYLEDSSVSITEPQIDNSGLPQGAFLNRSPLRKPSGELFQPRDFVPGKEVTINSRTFFVVDCDRFTRAHFKRVYGITVAPAEPFPEDPHMDTYTAAKKSMVDPTRSRKVGNGAVMKGRPSLAPKKDVLGQFLKYDRQVLRFYCIWNDTKRHAGQERRFILHYFLSDDTMEIREQYGANCGRDPFPLLLVRQRIPRDFLDKATPDLLYGRDEKKYIVDSDLVCGKFVPVFGRRMLLLDCDDFTRQHFAQTHGIEQVTVRYDKALPEDKRRDVAPYNGFGSEEDSLANCINLVPKKVLMDLRLFLKNTGKVLRYRAKFANPPVEDAARRFIITYFLEDDSISIYEPPQQNSGIVGGKFLMRGKYKLPGREKLSHEMGHTKTPLQAALSDRIQSRMSGGGHGLMRAFKHFGKTSGGPISYGDFKHGLLMVGLICTDEEARMLFESYDYDGGGTLDFHEFVQGVMADAHGKHGSDASRHHSRYIRSSDIQPGKGVRIMFPRTGKVTQEFRVLEADGYTKQMMHDHPELFPQTNVQAVANQMPGRLSELGVKIKSVFNQLDVHKRGYITPQQFSDQIRTWAIDLGFVDKGGLTDAEADQLVRHYNANMDDKIHIDEFCEAFSVDREYVKVHTERVRSVESKLTELLNPSNPEDMRRRFAEIDRDCNGKITFKEFKTFLEDNGMLLNDAEKAYIMCTYDRDGDGCIDYQEMARAAFRRGSLLMNLSPAQKSLLKQEAMTDYLAILETEEEKTVSDSDLEKLCKSFAAAFSSRKMLLRKNFLQYDPERSGKINKTKFFKALDRTNPDFPRPFLDQLAQRLFPPAIEMRSIGYETFMKVFLKQDIPGILRFCIADQSPGLE